MPPKYNDADTDEEFSPAVVRLLQETRQASKDATASVAEALAALPQMLATALHAQAPAAQVPANGPGGVPVAAAAAVAGPPALQRDARDRRVPDFWEQAPAAWFRILDRHFTTAGRENLSEAHKFDLLLPLLQGSAVKLILRLVSNPPADVYTVAKDTLIRHFSKTPEDMAAELHGLSSFGDRSAVEHLEHMRSLQPNDPETALFRHIFLQCVPSHVRPSISSIQDLGAMAKAVDTALATTPAPLTVQAVDGLDSHVDAVSFQRDKLTDSGLCFIHARYGQDAHKCASNLCKMKKNIKKRSKDSGNSNAGGQ